MCGIAGVLGKLTFNPLGADLTHRGPDRTGEWSNDVLWQRHWRLRIVDLSPAADQPMVTSDGMCVLSYNGEIYNADEIRRELEAEGVMFRTTCDTEVVLELLHHKGTSAIERLRGMFAFSFWNGRDRTLTLTRDSFGIKPLVYASGSGFLAFASEIPALLALLPYRPSPNLTSLWHFFTFGFIPAPNTAFAGLFKVMPGEVLVFDEQATLLSRTVLPKPWLKRSASHRSETVTLRSAIIDSVREQFRADVPVGVFLSGGVDSNVLLAATREAGLEDVRTFTVRFHGTLEGDSNDETSEARLSARFFQTEHTEVPIQLTGSEELLEDLDRFGEPFANPTVYLTRLLSGKTRQYVKVALTGVGGDELFGGYPRYAALRSARLLRSGMGRAAAYAGRVASHALGRYTPRSVRRLAWLVGSGRPGLSRAYLEWTYYLNEEEKAAMFPRLRSAAIDSLETLDVNFSNGYLASRPFLAGPLSDLAMSLPDNLLAYTDIGSMAASLEVRVPFLDPDVAYLALQQLRSVDLGYYRPKRLLRALFEPDLPRHVLVGRKKGFNPPLARWIRESLDQVLDSDDTKAFRKAFVDEEELTRMRVQHARGIEDYSQELFSVITAARWYNKWC